MAGTSNASENFKMRVPKEELADWRRRAAALSRSVAELIRLRMRLPDDQPAEVRLPTAPTTKLAAKAKARPPRKVAAKEIGARRVAAKRVATKPKARKVKASVKRAVTRPAYVAAAKRKPVAALNLPVLTDFPAREVKQRGAGKGKK